MNQAKLRSFRRSPKYKFGYQVPNNHAEAMLLDKKNLNSKWADAEEKERACFREYQVFKDIGKNGRPPAGYKPLKILTVYDVKHDGQHRARMVAAGHLDKISTRMCEGHDRESPALRWLTLCVEEVSSRAPTKGFPLLNISVGLLFVPQSGIGVHTGGGN